jgi:hypothetical protein
MAYVYMNQASEILDAIERADADGGHRAAVQGRWEDWITNMRILDRRYVTLILDVVADGPHKAQGRSVDGMELPVNRIATHQ